MKFVRGVTLTPEERRRVGLDASYPSQVQSKGAAVSAQTYEITLPNGQTCAAAYQRVSASLHHFTYPLSPQQRVWHNGRLVGSQAIEAKAQELAGAAFRQRQEAERKEMARCKPPDGVSSHALRPALMSARNAQRQAGYYTVCHQSGNGLLLPVGTLYARPERAQGEAREALAPVQGGRLVIGICCRWERRWRPAQWLALPPDDAEAEADTGDEGETATEPSGNA